jgi:hypothetical protein
VNSGSQVNGGPAMAPNTGTSNWLSIAQQVTVEMDSHKLCVLVNQLCAALDEEAERKRPGTPPFIRSTVS